MKNVEMTLRAIVDGKQFGKIRLPDPIQFTAKEAERIAMWARPFSGTCLTDIQIHVGDIKPSSGLMVLSDLDPKLGKRIKAMLTEARRYGFGLRLMRETANDPYELSITRRTIDVPQLTVTARSLFAFLNTLGFLAVRTDTGPRENQEARVSIEVFAERLSNRYEKCMEDGVAHYREYSLRIVEYGKANGATEIIWGPERRGAVAEEVSEDVAEAA